MLYESGTFVRFTQSGKGLPEEERVEPIAQSSLILANGSCPFERTGTIGAAKDRRVLPVYGPCVLDLDRRGCRMRAIAASYVSTTLTTRGSPPSSAPLLRRRRNALKLSELPEWILPSWR